MTALVRSTFPAESLLDAGCGDGRFLAAIARARNRPARLVGCDISQRILDTARQTVEREGVTAEFFQANMERLPFEDGSFDRVLSVQVIEHLLDVAAGISELARVLRPGGILVLSTDNAQNRVSIALNTPRRLLVEALHLTGRRLKVTFPHRSFRPSEVTSAVEQAGLTVEHVETFKFHIDGLDVAVVKRPLNLIDRALPAHMVGDIVAVVARKRGAGRLEHHPPGS